MNQIPHFEDSGLILPSLSAIAAVLILLGVWGLSIAAGFGRYAALASGLIVISAPFFVPVAHFVGPMPMAAALMLLALAFFARGWLKSNAWICLSLGFVFTALAGLCGGVIYFATPLLASFCFLIWQASFRRAQAWDAIFGFALMLVLTGGWLSWVTLGGNDNTYLSRLLAGHMLLQWPPVPLWWRALLIGFVGIVPWSLLVFTVSWHRVLSKSPASLAASRKSNSSALVWLALIWVMLFSPFMQLPPMAGLPIIFLVGVLLGRAFINLSPLGNRTFFLLAGLVVCILGLVLLAASFGASREWLFALLPFKIPAFVDQLLESIGHLYLLGALLILVGAGAFFFARRYRQAGGLLYGVIAAIAITQFAVFMIAPDLAQIKNGPLLNLQEIKARIGAAAQPIEAPAQLPVTVPEAGEAVQTPAPDASANPAIPEKNAGQANQESSSNNVEGDATAAFPGNLKNPPQGTYNAEKPENAFLPQEEAGPDAAGQSAQPETGSAPEQPDSGAAQEISGDSPQISNESLPDASREAPLTERPALPALGEEGQKLPPSPPALPDVSAGVAE